MPLVIDALQCPAGVCRRAVSLIDLFPTLNQLCGLPAIDSHDGQSLRPLLIDPLTKWDRPAVIEFRKGNAAVRSDRYRYIRYAEGGEELYDHEHDPQEWQNVAGRPDMAEVKTRLAKWLPANWAASAATKKEFEFDAEKFTWKHKRTGRITDGKKN